MQFYSLLSHISLCKTLRVSDLKFISTIRESTLIVKQQADISDDIDVIIAHTILRQFPSEAFWMKFNRHLHAKRNLGHHYTRLQLHLSMRKDFP